MGRWAIVPVKGDDKCLDIAVTHEFLGPLQSQLAQDGFECKLVDYPLEVRNIAEGDSVTLASIRTRGNLGAVLESILKVIKP